MIWINPQPSIFMIGPGLMRWRSAHLPQPAHQIKGQVAWIADPTPLCLELHLSRVEFTESSIDYLIPCDSKGVVTSWAEITGGRWRDPGLVPVSLMTWDLNYSLLPCKASSHTSCMGFWCQKWERKYYRFELNYWEFLVSSVTPRINESVYTDLTWSCLISVANSY